MNSTNWEARHGKGTSKIHVHTYNKLGKEGDIFLQRPKPIGLPTVYLLPPTLYYIYLSLDTAFPSSAALLALLREMLGFLAQWASTC